MEIPSEVWAEILIRTPVNSILRNRAVCKSWKDLIDSRYLIDLHFKFNHNKIVGYLALAHQENLPLAGTFFKRLLLQVDSNMKRIVSDTDLFPLPYCQKLLGYAKGLVLLKRVGGEGPLLVTNPVLRKSIALPSSNISQSSSISAIGYDPINLEHKVIHFGYDFCLKTLRNTNLEQSVAIYSLKFGVWRIKPLSFGRKWEFFLSGDVNTVVGDSIYWLCRNIRPRLECFGFQATHLACFDMVQEELSFIPLKTSYPNSLVFVFSMGDCLGLMETTVQFCAIHEYNKKNQSWKSMWKGESTFGAYSILLHTQGVYSLYLPQKNVFLFDSTGRLWYCSLDTPYGPYIDEVDHLGLGGLNYSINYVHSYCETLLLH